MFRYPNIKVTRINLRPLLPPGALERVNPSRVLKSIHRELVKKVQAEILKTGFSHRAKAALKDGFEIRQGRNSVTIVATHPGFRPLLEGRRMRQMRWLVKATRPIPIITEQGELIFRNATPRSMENGSWYHPQRRPTGVLERAKEEAREVIKARVIQEIRKQARVALARAKRR